MRQSIIIIIKDIYIAQVRKGHKCAMSVEMAVWFLLYYRCMLQKRRHRLALMSSCYACVKKTRSWREEITDDDRGWCFSTSLWTHRTKMSRLIQAPAGAARTRRDAAGGRRPFCVGLVAAED